MNYNANTGGRPSRKIKRVSDVNSMGYSPFQQPQPDQPQPNIYPNLQPEQITQMATTMPPNMYQQQEYTSQTFQQGYAGTPNQIPTQNYPYGPSTPFGNNVPGPVPQLGVFGQPVVQDMALQYGQQLASTGTTILKKEVERFVPVTKLKYYFAVDTTYVMKKLALLLFPFLHKDWSVKYEQDNLPIQPRFEINVPDLYIPTMAYVTYVVVAALVLGTQQRFSPEQIGLLSSTALAWCLVEIAVYNCILYVMNIGTTLRALDLVAYSGYKFVGIIISILTSLIAGKTAYYGVLVYTNIALGFYLVRALKIQVLSESTSYYGDVSAPSSGHKRRLYFLLFVAALQPVLSWWLTFHLNGSDNLPSSKVGDM